MKEIIKRNMFSIVCSVVALLAVVFAFFPMNGMFARLNGEVSKSKEKFDQIKSTKEKTFTKPGVDLQKTEAPPLNDSAGNPVFPSERIIEKGRQIVAQIHTESDRLNNLAVSMNRHEPLVPGSLPSGTGVSMGEFKTRYWLAMQDLKKYMNSTPPVNSEEIRKEETRLLEDVWKPRIVNQNGVNVNEAEVMAKFEEVRTRIPSQMKLERAQKFSMYIASDRAMDFHYSIPKAEDANLPEPLDVWIAQLSLWIQQDVATAVVQSNSAPDGRPLSIENAIVKRLWGLEIRKEYVTKTGYVQISTAQALGGPLPPGAVVIPDEPVNPNAAVPKQFGISSTGRVSNPLYDVMHITIKVDVDAEQFRTFMINVGRNKFITIRNADIRGVDREKAQRAGYVYGKGPVAQLILRCEAVLFREWTKPLMPQSVQMLLKIPQPVPGTVAGAQ